MVDIAFKALSFLRTSLSDVLARRIQSYLKSHDWVYERAMVLGQVL